MIARLGVTDNDASLRPADFAGVVLNYRTPDQAALAAPRCELRDSTLRS
jgi:hypothetical protein